MLCLDFSLSVECSLCLASSWHIEMYLLSIGNWGLDLYVPNTLKEVMICYMQHIIAWHATEQNLFDLDCDRLRSGFLDYYPYSFYYYPHSCLTKLRISLVYSSLLVQNILSFLKCCLVGAWHNGLFAKSLPCKHWYPTWALFIRLPACGFGKAVEYDPKPWSPVPMREAQK